MPSASSQRIGAVYAAARTNQQVVVLEGFHAVKHCIRFGGGPTHLVTDDSDALKHLVATHASDIGETVLNATVEIDATLFRRLVRRWNGWFLSCQELP